MSSTFSAVSEASPSTSNEPECEPSRSARSIRSAGASSQSTGQVSLATTTSGSFPGNDYGMTAILSAFKQFAEAFHAKTQALGKPNGESASGLTASELDSGERSGDWPLTYDRKSSFWRTCQASLVPDLEQFSGAWQRSGMMLNGVAYLHPRPVSPIDATGSALLPTPAARDFRDLSAGKAFLSQRKRHSPSLATKLLERGIHWTMLSTAYEVAMGFPSQWSDVELNPSEMRSSRKKSKPLGPRS